MLLNGGSDVNATSYIGDTALMFAISQCHTDVVRVLVNGGALVDITDDSEFDPLL